MKAKAPMVMKYSSGTLVAEPADIIGGNSGSSGGEPSGRKVVGLYFFGRELNRWPWNLSMTMTRSGAPSMWIRRGHPGSGAQTSMGRGVSGPKLGSGNFFFF